jgi:hypothetical protein
MNGFSQQGFSEPIYKIISLKTTILKYLQFLQS